MLEEANMIDINTHKKDPIKEEVKEFAAKMSVLEFHSMVSVHLKLLL